MRTFPGLFATVSRLPFFAPETDEGGGEEFVEQPGDREPDPAAAGEPPPDEGDGDQGADEGAGGAQEGDGEEPPAEGEGEEEPPAAAAPEKPKTNWKDRQIIKLRQQMKDRDAELARLKGASTETAPAGDATVPAGDGQDLVPRAEAEAAALRKFQQQDRFQKLNAASDAMFDAGAVAFPKDWGDRVKDAAEALGEDIVARPEFLETIVDQPNSAAVYHELAGDLDQMERILQMPLHRMGAEIAKISARLATPKPAARISRTPAPIKPLDTTSKDDLNLDDPNLSQDEFNRRMDKIEEAAFAAKRR